MYWFLRNLIALMLGVLCMPLLWAWQLIGALVILTVIDGSEVIAFPWEWDWME